MRGDPQFRSTGPWHYINLPAGLDRKAFDAAVRGMKGANLYEALTRMQQQLRDPRTSREDKVTALKFIVHLVGDAHQPMHVSRAADKGGNEIQVNYLGKGTNLHALWDSRLPEHAGLQEEQLASRVDKAGAGQVNVWQGDAPLQWLWESYQVSAGLYAEVEGMSKRTLSEAYYKNHMPTVEDRIQKGGIRLAGLLNEIFADGKAPGGEPVPAAAAPAGSQGVKSITLEEVASQVGREVRVCGRVSGSRSLSGITLVNLGRPYPHQLLTLVLKGAVRDIGNRLSEGTNVCVTGKVELYKGKPQLVVDKQELLEVGK
ncbi:S1/P1 nuclease [Paraflavisolibacter sp. H34]|uniref:S1/P1 nuclease n=1 Tax=Huijunlia imazamoxiresistens TaxID=3127457 RepID=UPI0030199CED